MCQNRSANENSGTANQNGESHAQAQQRMYPNLDEIFENLMPENQSQFLRDFLAGIPSAPPGNERDSNPQQRDERCSSCRNSAGGWRAPANESSQSGTDRPTNQSAHRSDDQSGYRSADDDVTMIFQRLGRQLAMKFANFAGIFMMALPILLAPKCLLIFGIFSAILKSFGIPMTPVVLAGIAYEILTAMDPILITVLAFWTIWKTWVLKKPLVDVQYWKQRFTARCNQ